MLGAVVFLPPSLNFGNILWWVGREQQHLLSPSVRRATREVARWTRVTVRRLVESSRNEVNLLARNVC